MKPYRARYVYTKDGVKRDIVVGYFDTVEKQLMHTVCHYISNPYISDASKERFKERYKNKYGIEVTPEDMEEHDLWIISSSQLVGSESIKNSKTSKSRYNNTDKQYSIDLFNPEDSGQLKKSFFTDSMDISLLEDISIGNTLFMDDLSMEDTSTDYLKVGSSSEITKADSIGVNPIRSYPVKYSCILNGYRQVIELGNVDTKEKALMFATLNLIRNPNISESSKKKHRKAYNYIIPKEIKEEYNLWIKEIESKNKRQRLYNDEQPVTKRPKPN